MTLIALGVAGSVNKEMFISMYAAIIRIGISDVPSAPRAQRTACVLNGEAGQTASTVAGRNGCGACGYREGRVGRRGTLAELRA